MDPTHLVTEEATMARFGIPTGVVLVTVARRDRGPTCRRQSVRENP
jgi:hypothetical protein